MAFERDIQIIEDIVRSRDPSFAQADPADIAAAVAALRRAAGEGRDRFLLAAMRLVALGRNAHSRIIPNGAIRVVPLRFVSFGGSVYLTEGAAREVTDHRLVAVNGLDVGALFARAAPYLAGPPSRQRVIGALLLAWPAALEVLGVRGAGESVRYTFAGPDGETRLSAGPDETVPAHRFYPDRERGRLAGTGPRTAPRWADCTPLGDRAWHIRLPDFFCDEGSALEDALEAAGRTLLSAPRRALVFDLRGNPGGDFLKTMPFIETVAERWRGRAAAVLVDKFTFSAAIVFTAILTHRLAGRIWIVGEPMGDVARFHAEGDTAPLPDSGAAFRYSTAYHDWETGLADATTPPEIARHLVAAGPLLPDRLADITAGDLRHGRDPQLDAALELTGL